LLTALRINQLSLKGQICAGSALQGHQFVNLKPLNLKYVPPPGSEEFLFFFFSSAARNFARASSAGELSFSLMYLGYYLSVAGIRRNTTNIVSQMAALAKIAGIACNLK
jgi:hypothetical protein